MDHTEALSFVRLRLQPDVEPTLDTAEVESLLELAATCDANGVQPGGDGWVPTYSVVGCYRAIAEGYLVKHGRVAHYYDFTTDGQTFRRDQMLDHIEHQRRKWARKVQATPSTLGGPR